jgi:hypothetical protein
MLYRSLGTVRVYILRTDIYRTRGYDKRDRDVQRTTMKKSLNRHPLLTKRKISDHSRKIDLIERVCQDKGLLEVGRDCIQWLALALNVWLYLVALLCRSSDRVRAAVCRQALSWRNNRISAFQVFCSEWSYSVILRAVFRIKTWAHRRQISLTQLYKILFSDIKMFPVLKANMLRSSLNVNVFLCILVTKLYLIYLFLNSSPVVVFWIGIVFNLKSHKEEN